MSSSCAALAANLSANYQSPAVYDGISSLAQYLSVTGVLISLCLFENCTTSIHSFDHISGSWLQHNTTGPRIYGNGFHYDGGVGMILDPQQMDIQCLYSLNGDTARRRQAGCGPIPWEDEIDWWNKAKLKSTLYWKKYTQFRNTKWKDIPCSQLFQGIVPIEPNRIPLMIDKQQTWISVIDLNQRVLADVVMDLDTICYDDVGPDFDLDYNKIGYDGDEPWWPSEWNASLAVTANVISQHPTNLGIWNEVIMKQLDPTHDDTNYSDFVLAMFYVSLPHNRNNRKLVAHKEAQRLGIEHVLEFDIQSTDGNLFKCPPSESTLDSSPVADS